MSIDKPLKDLTDEELHAEIERRRIAASTSNPNQPPKKQIDNRQAKDWTPEETRAFERQNGLRNLR